MGRIQLFSIGLGKGKKLPGDESPPAPVEPAAIQGWRELT